MSPTRSARDRAGPGPAGAPAGSSTLRALRDRASRGERHRYGPRPQQMAELRLPAGEGPHPVAVILHGGYWQARYSRRVTRPLAADLARRGWASWNLEFRRVGRRQGAAGPPPWRTWPRGSITSTG